LRHDADEKKNTAERDIPWDDLRRLYLLDCSRPSLAETARRFDAPLRAVRKRAATEGWSVLRRLTRKLARHDDPQAWQRLLQQKALRALLASELSSPTESMRLLELALKVARQKDTPCPADTRYIAEWGDGA